MVKPFILFPIITFVISLSGCAKKTTAVELKTPAPAPLYSNKVSEKTSSKLNISKPNKISEVNTAKSPVKKPESTDVTNPVVQTGRYTVIKAVPSLAQRNLLKVMITVTIPPDIKSIDETIRYLLMRSGYRMQLVPIQGQKVIQILSKTLPEIHRKIGPMHLIDALTMLTTPAFELITDPVKREIRYQLKNNYKTRYQNSSGIKL
jgi:type IV pili sensor histidine kinase/response regulator